MDKEGCPHQTVSSAVEEGCAQCLKQQISLGAAADGMNNLGWRPIHVAAKNNHVECLKFLITEGASDVNWGSFEKQTPLMLACEQGHIEVCRVLIDHGADVTEDDNFARNALMYAVSSRQHACAKLLSEIKTSTSGRYQIDWTDYNGSRALLQAVENGDIDMMEILLRAGADPTLINSRTCFNIVMTALTEGHLENFEKVMNLLKSHCSEFTFKILINYKVKKGYFCARFTDYRTLRRTLSGLTPLSLAAKLKVSGPLRTLLQYGADPNESMRCGLAIFAALEGCLENLKLLLPPVTDLDSLLLAHRDDLAKGVVNGDSAPWRTNLCILTAAAISDLDSEDDRSSEFGQRLQLLLESGCKFIVNSRAAVDYELSDFQLDTTDSCRPRSYPKLFSWGRMLNPPPGIQKMFGSGMTPLTRMIMEDVPTENIKIMLEYGASWKLDYSRVEFSTVPFHFFLNNSQTIELIAKAGFSLDIHHPAYAFNLTIISCLLSPETLNTLLRMGAECRSCFIPRTEDACPHAWTFEKFLEWFQTAGVVYPILTNYDLEYKKLSQSAFSGALVEPLITLLEYSNPCPRPSVFNWMCDLFTKSEHREKLTTATCRVPELQHLCRIRIRRYYGPALVSQPMVLDRLGLPREVNQYLLYE